MSIHNLPDAEDGLLPYSVDSPDLAWEADTDAGEITLFPPQRDSRTHWITIDAEHATTPGEWL